MCECLFCVCKHPDPLTKLSLGPCHYISCILHKHYLCSCNLAAFQDAASLMCQSWTCNGERGAPSICRHLFCFLLLREAMSPDGLTPPPLCFTAKMAATEWRERDLALRRQGLWGAHSASPESLCCSRKEQSRAVLTDWTCQWEHESRWQKQHCWCLCSVGQAWILAARYAKKQQRGRGNKLQWHSSINPSFFQPITWHKGLSAPLLLLTGWLHAVSHSCPLYWTSHDGGCSSQARRVKETEPDWSN